MTKNRHLKSTRKSTWTDLRVEIKKLCEQLSISTSEFSEVNAQDWKAIEANIWTRFSSKQNTRWIWESLSHAYASMPVTYETLDLAAFTGTSEKMWFLLDETVNEQTKFWIYEGTIDAFNELWGESVWMDEIMIVSKKYEWILIINHHDILIGTGEMKDKIDALKKAVSTV